MTKVIIYAALTNPYAQLVEVETDKVWDVTNSVLALTPTYTDTDITMSLNAYYNGYRITIPTSLPAGEYDLLVKENASPANTDTVAVGKRIFWTGTQLLGLPQSL